MQNAECKMQNEDEGRGAPHNHPAAAAAPLPGGELGEKTLKVCYYCGKRVPADAPRCGTCGNDRSFTWTGER